MPRSYIVALSSLHFNSLAVYGRFWQNYPSARPLPAGFVLRSRPARGRFALAAPPVGLRPPGQNEDSDIQPLGRWTSDTYKRYRSPPGISPPPTRLPPFYTGYLSLQIFSPSHRLPRPAILPSTTPAGAGRRRVGVWGVWAGARESPGRPPRAGRQPQPPGPHSEVRAWWPPPRPLPPPLWRRLGRPAAPA